jgi:hypothetical protein
VGREVSGVDEDFVTEADGRFGDVGRLNGVLPSAVGGHLAYEGVVGCHCFEDTEVVEADCLDGYSLLASRT